MTTIEFNSLLIQQKDILKGFALNLTRNKEDALDLVQETILKALTYRDKFANKTNFKAWLMTIMKNTFINSYRRNVMGTNIKGEIKITTSKSYNQIDSYINTKDLKIAIDKLKDEYKIPFERFVEGFKYHEIAEELQLPIGTVKSRIFIARNKLASYLKEKNTQN